MREPLRDIESELNAHGLKWRRFQTDTGTQQLIVLIDKLEDEASPIEAYSRALVIEYEDDVWRLEPLSGDRSFEPATFDSHPDLMQYALTLIRS